MPRRSALRVVPPATTSPPPPSDLGEHGRALWVAIAGDYEIDDAADAANLRAAAKTQDLVAELEAELAQDGVAGAHANQSIKHLIAARALVARLLKGVTTTPPHRGRPPGHTGGWV
jgi:hypothetical protein